MVLVSDDGEVDITEGIADRFELSNTKDYHLNVISRSKQDAACVEHAAYVRKRV